MIACGSDPDTLAWSRTEHGPNQHAVCTVLFVLAVLTSALHLRSILLIRDHLSRLFQ